SAPEPGVLSGREVVAVEVAVARSLVDDAAGKHAGRRERKRVVRRLLRDRSRRARAGQGGDEGDRGAEAAHADSVAASLSAIPSTVRCVFTSTSWCGTCVAN